MRIKRYNKSMLKKGKERRVHSRIPIAADVGEPIEISIPRNPANGNKSTSMPAILANISAGGMALIAFGAEGMIKEDSRLNLTTNLPGMTFNKIACQVVHVRCRSEMQTIGVRFTTMPATVKNRIAKLINDYDDCETRMGLGIPEVCTGKKCRYFALCKKTQKAFQQ